MSISDIMCTLYKAVRLLFCVSFYNKVYLLTFGAIPWVLIKIVFILHCMHTWSWRNSNSLNITLDESAHASQINFVKFLEHYNSFPFWKPSRSFGQFDVQFWIERIWITIDIPVPNCIYLFTRNVDFANFYPFSLKLSKNTLYNGFNNNYWGIKETQRHIKKNVV